MNYFLPFPFHLNPDEAKFGLKPRLTTQLVWFEKASQVSRLDEALMSQTCVSVCMFRHLQVCELVTHCVCPDLLTYRASTGISLYTVYSAGLYMFTCL